MPDDSSIVTTAPPRDVSSTVVIGPDVEVLTVGFDLDMTLADSRAGIVATVQAVMAERGVNLSDDEIWPTIGIPLEAMFAGHLPDADIDEAAQRYRELFPALALPLTTVMPGAEQTLAAVRALHGRVAVVSAKAEPAVRQVLERVGLSADIVVGGLFGADKGRALVEHGVSVYVGDHVGDVAAAIASGAVPVAVTTGPKTAEELRSAGAEQVLESLAALPAWLDEHVLDHRLALLDARLRSLGSVVVAFSGGADSAMLLAAAVRALGADNVVAATAVSYSLADGELEGAREFAAGLGVRHLTPHTDELSREGYQANAGDRCFFCKAELLEVVGPLAQSLGVAAVATGTNADDVLAGFRPGIRAAAERGAVTPLRDAGLTKAQVRAASRRWGLVTSDKPAAACLSSRIAFGVRITRDGLARVDRAEHAVRALLTEAGVAVRDLRVRDLGQGRARVEIGQAALARVLPAPRRGDQRVGSPDDTAAITAGTAGFASADGAELEAAARLHTAVLDAVRSCGFDDAEVDSRGFRSGSMNELLADPDRYR